jgi:hypothetical protein
MLIFVELDLMGFVSVGHLPKVVETVDNPSYLVP